MGVIFRNDDVNPNSDYDQLMEMYDIILEAIPDAEIWTVWCPICKNLNSDNMYPDKDLPIKNQAIDYFYKNADKIGLPRKDGRYFKMCSHGLIHFNHKGLPYELQEMSIVTSCFMLDTKTFIPPFSEYDKNTEDICAKFGIELVKRDGWMPLDYHYQNFDPKYKKWYFHSWRYTPERLRERVKHEHHVLV